MQPITSLGKTTRKKLQPGSNVQRYRCQARETTYNPNLDALFLVLILVGGKTTPFSDWLLYHVIQQKGIFELPFASVSKRVPVLNFSYENELDLHENKLGSETHFHKNELSRRLIFTSRQ